MTRTIKLQTARKLSSADRRRLNPEGKGFHGLQPLNTLWRQKDLPQVEIIPDEEMLAGVLSVERWREGAKHQVWQKAGVAAVKAVDVIAIVKAPGEPDGIDVWRYGQRLSTEEKRAFMTAKVERQAGQVIVSKENLAESLEYGRKEAERFALLDSCEEQAARGDVDIVDPAGVILVGGR